MAAQFDLDTVIRKVPDFPKPGILFYDVTGILVHPEAFAYCVDVACERYAHAALDAIAAIDARGFVFASPIAYRMSLPLVLVRKNGKLPGRTIKRRFALEYGEDTVEVHRSDVRPGQKILIVDDLIATGGTLKAAADILSEAGAAVAGIFAVIGLPFLNYRNVLAGHEIATLIDYHSEHPE
ncbi:MAG: adenine phosphoribosyltransferase [Spirochaetaceae bacterium]|nr:MAG: adenine phosphoribosyltransferase [Spirochaetaceae bacterium]